MEKVRETVTVWCWDNTFNVKAMRLAEEAYEKEHPEVDIRVVSMEQENIIEQLDNNFVSGIYEKLPDIVLIEDYRSKACLNKFQEEFLDITEEIDYSNFMDYKVNAVTVGGRRYGVPFDSGAAVMFYREDIIGETGYTKEDMENITWDRYIEIGRDVYSKTGMKMITLDPSDLGILRIMLQSAGSWYVKNEGREADIEDSQALKDALHTYISLLDSGVTMTVNGWDESVSAYQQEKVASVITGSWSASSIKESPQQAGKWRLARIPRMGENQVSVNASGNGGSAWYILKRKGDGRAALDFLKAMFVENPEFINLLMEEINLTGVQKDMSTYTNYEKGDEYFCGQPFFKICAETAEDIPNVDVGSHTYEIEEILTGVIQSLVKKEDEASVLHQAQIKAEGVLGTEIPK